MWWKLGCDKEVLLVAQEASVEGRWPVSVAGEGRRKVVEERERLGDTLTI